jgi:hypothetical protein
MPGVGTCGLGESLRSHSCGSSATMMASKHPGPATITIMITGPLLPVDAVLRWPRCPPGRAGPWDVVRRRLPHRCHTLNMARKAQAASTTWGLNRRLSRRGTVPSGGPCAPGPT